MDACDCDSTIRAAIEQNVLPYIDDIAHDAMNIDVQLDAGIILHTKLHCICEQEIGSESPSFEHNANTLFGRASTDCKDRMRFEDVVPHLCPHIVLQNTTIAHR